VEDPLDAGESYDTKLGSTASNTMRAASNPSWQVDKIAVLVIADGAFLRTEKAVEIL